MRAVLVKPRASKGVLPPTMPEKDISPEVPACSVKAVAPSSVLEKLIVAPPAAPAAVLNVRGVAVRAVFPASVMVPALVVIFPPTLMAVRLELVLVAEMAPSAVVEPMFPEKVIVPVEPDFTVNACDPAAPVPSIVEEKIMFAPVANPPFVVSNVGLLVKETGPVIVMAPLPVVVAFPSTLMAVDPV